MSVPSATPGTSPVSIDEVLRFCQAGHCCPSRLNRTNRALPNGSSLAANRDLRVPGSTEESPGLLGKGVAFRRPRQLSIY